MKECSPEVSYSENLVKAIVFAFYELHFRLQTGSSRFCFISIFLFLYIIFLSWSSLIQLQVSYGWTKTF